PYFVEGKTAELKYIFGDRILERQSVVYNNETGELYADFLTPDGSEYVSQGYTLVWDLPTDGKIPTTLNVYAHAEANRYTVTLVSEKPLEGFIESENGYTLTLTYVYNDGFYTADGEKYFFPDVDIQGEKVGAFENGEISFASFDDCSAILSDMTLCATW
ncbi:MAG: hypothetical protein K2N74_02570, partial [Clostridiales bacterium]|nr:hypothetical protein [Clostridiales bacterium]